jgi:hypothetical protein
VGHARLGGWLLAALPTLHSLLVAGDDIKVTVDLSELEPVAYLPLEASCGFGFVTAELGCLPCGLASRAVVGLWADIVEPGLDGDPLPAPPGPVF